MAAIIATRPLSDTVGAEVLDVDRDRLLGDPEVTPAIEAALSQHGFLLLRGMALDDDEQIAFGRGLGELVVNPGKGPGREVTVITQSADNPLSAYFKGNAQWHIDGSTDDVPCKAALLTARVVSSTDGGTEFASTYAAYDELTDGEKARVEDLRVVHSIEATLRTAYENPTPEQVADWRRRPAKEHPLVWKHRSGRRSLVIGSTADYVIGMDPGESRALLSDLVARACRPERVVCHNWSVGDLVIWDNTGLVHRVTHHDPTSHRELHRVTVAGDEPIQ